MEGAETVAAVIVEPLCDVVGMIYHPEIGQITAYEALGRKIPWHVVLFLIGAGAIHWARKLMSDEEIVAERHGQRARGRQ